MKRIIINFLCCLTLFVIFLKGAPSATAQEYKTLYEVRYTLHLNGDSEVDLRIKITNLRSDIYVKEFSLSFPSSFAISNLTARDDRGVVLPTIESQDRFLKVSLSFESPAIGKGSENNFYLHFLQKNLFKTEGNIWEAILPTISNKTNTTYDIRISLPETSDKKLSIAKPKPTRISKNVIYWDDIKTRTVYAVFGQAQFYDLNLVYRLRNDELKPVYYEIALPPETLYQKVFVTSLKPEPDQVYLDDDDNFLARYNLKVKEQKLITFEGSVAVFPQPRADLKAYFGNNFDKQKNYLLSRQKFWDLDELKNKNELKNLQTVEDIYRYVTDKLTYNYDRISDKITRLGAKRILQQPDQAVCMEFTDLFVALARAKGIATREINGYGFSEDQNLRPLSLVADILHSWPEYFDENNKLWLPVDPTWENTSGIDYWSSFDMNHVVFAIHGRDSTYPVPAGFYKTDPDSKDISIAPTKTLPQEISTIDLNENLKKELIDNRSYKGSLSMINTGNVFIKNATIEIKTGFVTVNPQKFTVDLVAPYQTVDFSFDYQVPKITKSKYEKVVFSFNNQPVRSTTIKIIPFYQNIFYLAAGIAVGLIIFLILYRYARP